MVLYSVLCAWCFYVVAFAMTVQGLFFLWLSLFRVTVFADDSAIRVSIESVRRDDDCRYFYVGANGWTASFYFVAVLWGGKYISAVCLSPFCWKGLPNSRLPLVLCHSMPTNTPSNAPTHTFIINVHYTFCYDEIKGNQADFSHAHSLILSDSPSVMFFQYTAQI